MNNSIILFFNHVTQTSRFVRGMAIFLSGIFAFVILPPVFFFTVVLPSNNPYGIFFICCLVAVASFLFSGLLKLFIKLPRPFHVLSTIVPVRKPSGFSFPSEHAAVFASLAFIATFIFPSIGIWFCFAAFFIGLSRVALGVHYPTDVCAGFILGSIISFITIIIFHRYI